MAVLPAQGLAVAVLPRSDIKRIHSSKFKIRFTISKAI